MEKIPYAILHTMIKEIEQYVKTNPPSGDKRKLVHNQAIRQHISEMKQESGNWKDSETPEADLMYKTHFYQIKTIKDSVSFPID
jgi:hypothetical protein